MTTPSCPGCEHPITVDDEDNRMYCLVPDCPCDCMVAVLHAVESERDALRERAEKAEAGLNSGRSLPLMSEGPGGTDGSEKSETVTAPVAQPTLDLIAERDALRDQRDILARAIFYTTELYVAPLGPEDSTPNRLRYTVKGKLKPNLSIGFETRYQAMYDRAVEFAPHLEGQCQP